ncbi:protein MpUGT22 [Marchantia polymorpha subsp. ruderalis]
MHGLFGLYEWGSEIVAEIERPTECCHHRSSAMEQGAKEKRDLPLGLRDCRAGPKPHVWLMPYCIPSHANAFYHLGRLLASQGVTVTLLAAASEIERLLELESRLPVSSRRDGLDFHLKPVSDTEVTFGDGIVDLEIRIKYYMRTEADFSAVLKASVEHGSPPTCILADFWLTKTLETASQCGIPAFIYSLFSASLLSAVIYVQRLESAGILKLPGYESAESWEELISLPGLSMTRIADLPEPYLADHHMRDMTMDHGTYLQKAEVIVFSNCRAMEGGPFREFQRILKASPHRKSTKMPEIFHVGPTFLEHYSLGPGSKEKEIGDQERHPILKFLDTHSTDSVIFVAFGLVSTLKQEQILEIAYGLQNSEQPFVCVLNPPSRLPGSDFIDLFSVIPPDCIAQTKGRGLFVKFAPQLQVLAHPSVGGFLSHCGQNSIMESLYMGVPILAWPIFMDQPINSRWLVSEAQAGLEISRERAQVVDRKEVERGVRALFQGDEGRSARKKALEMKQVIREAVGENGSSVRDLEALVALIKGL